MSAFVHAYMQSMYKNVKFGSPLRVVKTMEVVL